MFKPAPTNVSFPRLEEEILAFWKRAGIYEESLRRRSGAPRFVFFEGPPTANGRPGIHHVFARTIKDLFCRHRAMRARSRTRTAPAAVSMPTDRRT